MFIQCVTYKHAIWIKWSFCFLCDCSDMNGHVILLSVTLQLRSTIGRFRWIRHQHDQWISRNHSNTICTLQINKKAFVWNTFVTPCLLPRIRWFIHTLHHNTTLCLRPRVISDKWYKHKSIVILLSLIHCLAYLCSHIQCGGVITRSIFSQILTKYTT